MIYVYAIVDGPVDAADIQGIAGEPLTVAALAHDNIVLNLVTGEVPALPEVTPESLSAQDHAVRALHNRVEALLPMRFGAGFATLPDAERAVMLQAPGLRERLERVRRREQMTIRVTTSRPLDAAAHGAPRSGAEYLLERARPRELRPLLDALAPLVRATLVERGRSQDVFATVYQLIDHGTSGEYRRTVEAAAGDLSGLTIHVSGPSPCYAFA